MKILKNLVLFGLLLGLPALLWARGDGFFGFTDAGGDAYGAHDDGFALPNGDAPAFSVTIENLGSDTYSIYIGDQLAGIMPGLSQIEFELRSQLKLSIVNRKDKKKKDYYFSKAGSIQLGSN